MDPCQTLPTVSPREPRDCASGTDGPAAASAHCRSEPRGSRGFARRATVGWRHVTARSASPRTGRCARRALPARRSNHAGCRTRQGQDRSAVRRLGHRPAQPRTTNIEVPAWLVRSGPAGSGGWSSAGTWRRSGPSPAPATRRRPPRSELAVRLMARGHRDQGASTTGAVNEAPITTRSTPTACTAATRMSFWALLPGGLIGTLPACWVLERGSTSPTDRRVAHRIRSQPVSSGLTGSARRRLLPRQAPQPVGDRSSIATGLTVPSSPVSLRAGRDLSFPGTRPTAPSSSVSLRAGRDLSFLAPLRRRTAVLRVPELIEQRRNVCRGVGNKFCVGV